MQETGTKETSMPRMRRFDIRGGRPTHLWGLFGCGPYALVVTALCVVIVVALAMRGDPAAVAFAVALVLLFAPLAVIAFLARRQGAWTDQVPIWDDEPSDTSDATAASDAAPDADDSSTRDEAPRREVP